MLERVQAANGVVFYRSPKLSAAGVAHAFSTRVGGISTGAFASLNLGNPSEGSTRDPWDNIVQNHQRLYDAIKIAPRARLSCHQVHGCGVVRFAGGDWPEPQPQGDAIVSTDPTVVASVRVADCVPVLLATPDGRVVAAVHAGWRGVVAGVVTETIRAMRETARESSRDEARSDAQDASKGARDGSRRVRDASHNARGIELIAAIGAGISAERFEVGPEVAREFAERFPDVDCVRPGAGDRSFVDLQRVIVHQLVRAGMSEHAIDITDRCTVRDADEFFSHRRDRGVSGRMSALIVARGSDR